MKMLSSFLRLASFLAMIVLAGGCVNATFIPTQSTAYPSKGMYCEIEVISSGVPEGKRYEELGIVEAEGSAWKSDLEDVLPQMREAGGLAGGDALIMRSSDTYSSGGRDGVPVQRISATVIRWETK